MCVDPANCKGGCSECVHNREWRNEEHVRSAKGAGMSKANPFWDLYHRLMDWTDDDGLPSPDRQDAANWMFELRQALVQCESSGASRARLFLDQIDAGRGCIFPTKGAPKTKD